MTDLTFTFLICSRLCHDLVGPVGAIGNGIELMELDDDAALAEEALSLLKQSADNATRRLTFLRLAFGASGGEGTPLPVTDARDAARRFFADHRMDLVWDWDGGPEPGKGRVRLALNMIMVGAMGLRRGGTLTVGIDGAGAVTITGEHERAELSEPVVDALEGRRHAATTEDARIIEAFLTRLLAENEGLQLTLEQKPGRFSLSAR